MTYSDLMLNPIGGAETRRAAIRPDLGEDLMGRVVDRANMRRAWKPVKANKGAPGIDGRTLEEFRRTHERTGLKSANPCWMAPINPRRYDGRQRRSPAVEASGCLASPPCSTGW